NVPPLAHCPLGATAPNSTADPGISWINVGGHSTGYKPAWNFQKALIDGVERFLDREGLPELRLQAAGGAAQGDIVYLGPPPAPGVDPAEGNEPLKRLARKWDPAARDARNRDLGLRGEELALRSEHARLRAGGREDLARKIRWVSREDGDGAGYDILSFSLKGQERFLEVKATKGHARTPFYVSANEKSFADDCPDRFRLYRLYDLASTPPGLRNPAALRG
ncbi:DUF3883 domain-containing protein, partial [Actibacterium sp. MT2.3-13A]|uniref:DUF3883 domain-containing protein n=1 Tax=Actibacterium sp. MT2.3-13A TaxID=2828332 RepID=UPI001BACBE04